MMRSDAFAPFGGLARRCHMPLDIRFGLAPYQRNQNGRRRAVEAFRRPLLCLCEPAAYGVVAARKYLPVCWAGAHKSPPSAVVGKGVHVSPLLGPVAVCQGL